MLHLASTTSPAWVARALAHLDEILVDHAHCEKKAASTAVSLLFRYPERADLLAPLARLAREELEHFEQGLAHFAARGGRPTPHAAGPRGPGRRVGGGGSWSTSSRCWRISGRAVSGCPASGRAPTPRS